MGPVSKRIQELIENIQKQMEAAREAAVIEYGKWLENELRRIYREVIDAWYGAYRPVYHVRKYSLRNLLTMQSNPDGSVTSTLSSDGIANVYGSAIADYLYSLTFRSGWHGGALYGDSTHPTSMYWRTPANVWAHWGQPAKWSEPPREMLQERILQELPARVLNMRLGSILKAKVAEIMRSVY